MPTIQLTARSIIFLCDAALDELSKATDRPMMMREQRELFRSLRSKAEIILRAKGPGELVDVSAEELALIVPYL